MEENNNGNNNKDDDDDDALSLLFADRDYRTIGIGNIFASTMPLDHHGATVPQEEDNDDDDDDEWVGTIKRSPQDFVVREISLHGLVADLSLTANDMMIVNDVDPATTTTSIINHEKQPVVSSRRQKRKAEMMMMSRSSSSQNADDMTSMDPVAVDDDNDDDPRLQLAAVLATVAAVDPSLTTIWTVEDVLAKLTALDQRAKTTTTTTTTKTTATNSDDDSTITSITMTIQEHDDGRDESNRVGNDATTISIPSLGDKELRTKVHRALARTFPLLNSQTTGKDSITVSIDTRFDGLKPYLQDPVADLSLLLSLYRRSNNSNDNSTTKVRLRLKEGLVRADRRPVHKIIAERSNHMLQTNTISAAEATTMIEVGWAPRRNYHPDTVVVRTLGVIKKTGCEHTKMMKVLTKKLRLRGPDDLTVAGIKDRQAETYQFCVVSSSHASSSSRDRRQKAPPTPLAPLHLHNNDHPIEFRPLGPVSKQLERGELRANRFELVIRNVQRRRKQQRRDGAVAKTAAIVLDEAMVLHRFRQTLPFVNYYGEQRVGEPGDANVVGVRPPDVGRAMLQRNYGRAIDLILTGRKVIQGRNVETGMEDFRRAWQESGGDATAVVTSAIMKNNNIPSKERAILTALKRFPHDPLAALQSMPFHDRMFYVNAYQALVWNHAATQRLLLYGGQVVAGDLVVTDRSAIRQVQVVMAGEEAQFRMAQVVLPLPGWNVMYPQNAVAKVYEQMLAQDSIEFKKKQKGDDDDNNGEAESSAKGSYRFLLAQSLEPVRCHKMDGTDSDYRLTFDLGPGCYATMFLRELLRTKSGSGNSGTFTTTTAAAKDTLAPC